MSEFDWISHGADVVVPSGRLRDSFHLPVNGFTYFIVSSKFCSTDITVHVGHRTCISVDP